MIYNITTSKDDVMHVYYAEAEDQVDSLRKNIEDAIQQIRKNSE